MNKQLQTGSSKLKFVLAGIALYAFAGAAAAQWGGLYGGVNIGVAWSDTDTNHGLLQPNCGNPAVCPVQQAAYNSIAPGLSDTNFTGGVQTGYNWVSGRFILGLEADVNYWGLSKSSTGAVRAATPAPKDITSTDTIEASWVATLRPRLGYLVTNEALIYATAGLAVTDLKLSNQTSIFGTGPGQFTGLYSSSTTKMTGYVLGAGLEYSIAKNMTLKGEYQYLHFSGMTAAGSNTAAISTDLSNSTAVTTSGSVTSNILRVGVNWRF